MISALLERVPTLILKILVGMCIYGQAVSHAQVLQFDPLVDMVHESTRSPLPVGISRAGSGFYVSTNGYAVTSSHNVLGCNKIDVSIESASQNRVAKLIGIDTRLDLALLKIEGGNVVSLQIDDGAFGQRANSAWRAFDSNPQDRSPGRFVPLIERGIGASAGVQILRYAPALSVGSSGGPIVNQYGEVRGVVTSRWLNKQDNTSEALAVSSKDLARFLSRFGVSYVRRLNASGSQSRVSDDQLRGYLIDVFCSSR
ncbi:MAG: serine protease [Pseudomonadota bacterium]